MSEEIVHYETESQQAVAVWKPVMAVAEIASRQSAIAALMHQAMKRDLHYGIIPGTGKKPSLLKAGAEMLTTFFGLSKSFTILERTEDWTGKDHDGTPFFYYLVRCHLRRGDALIAEADASCNSMESKYRWRTEWKSGQKTRVPNDDIHSQVNTILKMAQKRALVAATLLAVGASDFFTQDIEDMAADYVEGEIVSETPTPVPSPTHPPAPQTKTARATNGQRPYAPDVLITGFRQRIDRSTKERDMAPPSDGQLTLLRSLLSKILPNEDERHTFQRVTTGKASTTDMETRHVKTMLDWLNPQQDGDKYTVGNEYARAEAVAVVRAEMTRDAVGKLPGLDRPDGWEQEAAE